MSGGGDDTTTVQKSDPWEGQQPYLADLFKQAGTQYAAGAPRLVGAQRAAQESAQEYGAAADTARGLAGSAAEGQQFLASGDVLDPSSNPALQQYLDLATQATTRGFTQNVLPALKSGAVQAGNVGGSRAGIAEGLATQGLQQTLAQQTAGITSAAYGQGLDAMGRGLALAPQTIAAQTAPGDIYQQQSQALAGIENLPYEQQRQLLADYQGLISGQPGGTQTAIGPSTRPGDTSRVVGGAASGYATTGSWYGAAAGAIAGYFS